MLRARWKRTGSFLGVDPAGKNRLRYQELSRVERTVLEPAASGVTVLKRGPS